MKLEEDGGCCVRLEGGCCCMKLEEDGGCCVKLEDGCCYMKLEEDDGCCVKLEDGGCCMKLEEGGGCCISWRRMAVMTMYAPVHPPIFLRTRSRVSEIGQEIQCRVLSCIHVHVQYL